MSRTYRPLERMVNGPTYNSIDGDSPAPLYTGSIDGDSPAPLYTGQSETCACCHETVRPGHFNWHARYRSWLCSKCMTLLTESSHSPTLLHLLASYIESHS
jgi:hypothetical protein